MEPGGIKDNEVFRSRLRKWTVASRVTQLKTKSQILEGIFVEKQAIPSLFG
jgi:hypothetical protein